MDNIKIVKDDIFKSSVQAIVHQTNCCGKFNAGFAREVREHYPEVYNEYYKLCLKYEPIELFGAIQSVKTLDERYIINLFGQLKYGRDKQYTNYDAFQNGLNLIIQHHPDIKILGFPYKIGCNLAGGDWNIVYSLIEETFKNTDKQITFFQKED